MAMKLDSEWECKCGDRIYILQFQAVPLADQWTLGVQHKGIYIAKVAVSMKLDSAYIAQTLVTNTKWYLENCPGKPEFERCEWVG